MAVAQVAELTRPSAVAKSRLPRVSEDSANIQMSTPRQRARVAQLSRCHTPLRNARCAHGLTTPQHGCSKHSDRHHQGSRRRRRLSSRHRSTPPASHLLPRISSHPINLRPCPRQSSTSPPRTHRSISRLPTTSHDSRRRLSSTCSRRRLSCRLLSNPRSQLPTTRRRARGLVRALLRRLLCISRRTSRTRPHHSRQSNQHPTSLNRSTPCPHRNQVRRLRSPSRCRNHTTRPLSHCPMGGDPNNNTRRHRWPSNSCSRLNRSSSHNHSRCSRRSRSICRRRRSRKQDSSHMRLGWCSHPCRPIGSSCQSTTTP
mmetsp:Transcript_79927/g.158858  ORF Transcript_79927/g.158858 Transcript_79927/m.158858 type:complete len:314 (+) Transcript_79927:345-1286(+)